MKCPYRDFKDCIVEKCPSCNYREVKKHITRGFCPPNMSFETAEKIGYMYECTETVYEFISCKLIENNVQPIPPKKEIINNSSNTSVAIKRSIF